MSSGINVYAVPLARLTQVVGSRDRSMIEAIVKANDDFLSGIGDIDPDAELTCADAVAGLINGDPPGDAPGYLYGYAVEAICWYVGEELPNICPISGASDWIEQVDALLEGKGIPLRLNALVYGGSPVSIPAPDDYPFIGNWSAAELAAARTPLENADLTDAGPEMTATLQQIRGWVEATAKQPDVSIVGFLS
jgi:hypothetical protein